MSGSIPFLGSKISLISKSEIRYEGILYTIDAQESIIALAKVRSFGTEDRSTEMPVPARDEVYEYIIFRGTDIKKIEVCDTPKQPSLPGGLHNDPAIVQHSAPTVGTSFQAAPFSRQSIGPVGAGMSGGMGMSYNNYGQSMSQQGLPGSGGFPVGSSQSSELTAGGASGGGNNNSVGASLAVSPRGASGSTSNVIQAPVGAPAQQPVVQSDVLVSSRSSTPTARKSPVSDAGVQVSSPLLSKEERKRSPKQQERSKDGKENQQYGARRQNNQHPHQQQHQQHQQHPQHPHQQHQQQHQHPHQHQQQQHQHPHQHPQHLNQHPHQQQSQGGNRQSYQDRNFGGYQNHGYQNQNYGFQGYRGRGRSSRRPQQARRGGQGYNNRRMQDQALFKEDFDFDKANEEFEELMNQLSKTKISENGDPKEVDTSSTSTKKEDSGLETGSAGESTTTEPNEEEGPSFYDKNKSFFDSISCEAIERSKGKSQRPDWRQERKMNVETFGVSSTRRGYYPRGRGGYRGGYYRVYQGYYNYNYRGGGGGGGGHSGGGRGNNGGGGGGGNFRGRKPAENRPAEAPNSYSSAVRNSTPNKT